MNKVKHIIIGNYKKIVLTFLIIAALIMLRFTFVDNKIYFSVYSDFSSKNVTVLANNKVVSTEINGGVLENSISTASNGKYCVFSVYTNENGSSYYSIYFATKRQCKLIAEKTKSEYLLSQNGNTVIYLDSDSKLHSYDIVTGSAKTVSQTADKFAVSPNGKTIIYSKYDDAGLSYVMYLYTKDKTTEISTELLPLAVSDNGKIIYATDLSSQTLFKVIDKDKIKISSLSSPVYFNEDLSRYTLSNSQGTYYHYDVNKFKLILEKKSVYPLSSTSNLINNSNSAYILDKKSLLGCYYITNTKKTSPESTELFFVDTNGGKKNIAGNISKIKLLPKEKSAVYLNSDELYKSKASTATLISKDVNSFSLLKNDIVYSNINDTLFRYTSKSKPIVYNIKKYFVFDGKIYYNLKQSPNILNSISNSKKITVVNSDIASFELSQQENYLFYYIKNENNTFSKYSACNSKKFILVNNTLSSII